MSAPVDSDLILVRNELYALMSRCLESLDRAEVFDWLSCFLERMKPGGIPLAELSAIARREQGLNDFWLRELMASANFLNISGHRLSLTPAAAPFKEYLQDRTSRYRAALKNWSSLKPPSDPFDKALAFSEILFNHGLFFDTHEYLEADWKASEGEKKTCLQGLIQIAAGFHKLELDPGARAGAAGLLQNGLEKLKASQGVLGGVAVGQISSRLAPILAALATGPAQAPRLSWSKIPTNSPG